MRRTTTDRCGLNRLVRTGSWTMADRGDRRRSRDGRAMARGAVSNDPVTAACRSQMLRTAEAHSLWQVVTTTIPNPFWHFGADHPPRRASRSRSRSCKRRGQLCVPPSHEQTRLRCWPASRVEPRRLAAVADEPRAGTPSFPGRVGPIAMRSPYRRRVPIRRLRHTSSARLPVWRLTGRRGNSVTGSIRTANCDRPEVIRSRSRPP